MRAQSPLIGRTRRVRSRFVDSVDAFKTEVDTVVHRFLQPGSGRRAGRGRAAPQHAPVTDPLRTEGVLCTGVVGEFWA